jgi:hypothetical protein
MARFRVTFFKNVCGDTGDEVDAPQGVIEVDADDEAGAVELAQRRFSRNRHISHWSVNADRLEAPSQQQCHLMHPRRKLFQQGEWA